MFCLSSRSNWSVSTIPPILAEVSIEDPVVHVIYPKFEQVVRTINVYKIVSFFADKRSISEEAEVHVSDLPYTLLQSSPRFRDIIIDIHFVLQFWVLFNLVIILQ